MSASTCGKWQDGANARMTIGAHGSQWKVEQARIEARKILRRAANGEDPARENMTKGNRPHLNAGALEMLRRQPRLTGSSYVFPASKSDGYYEGTPKVWRIVRAAVGLIDIRIHDLRHSFASIAVSRGSSLPIIGALLGHKNAATTQRLAHLHDDPVRSANGAVGSFIQSALADRDTDQTCLAERFE